jgi:hypothetical protein
MMRGKRLCRFGASKLTNTFFYTVAASWLGMPPAQHAFVAAQFSALFKAQLGQALKSLSP